MAAPGPYEGDPVDVPPEALGAPQQPADAPVDPAGAPPDPAAQPTAPPPPEPTALEAIEHAIVKMAEAAMMASDGMQAQGYGTGVRNLAEAVLTLTKADLAPAESEAERQLKAAQTVNTLHPPEPPPRPGESASSPRSGK